MEQIMVRAEKTEKTDANKDQAGGREAYTLKLHPAEMRLLQVIRSIEFGEIDGLCVESGLPSHFKGARKTCKLA